MARGPRKTALSLGGRMTRQRQIRFLDARFGTIIETFMADQAFIPYRLVRWWIGLDDSHKAWTFAIETQRYGLHYRFRFMHRTLNETWLIDYTISYRNQPVRTEKLSFRDPALFYPMALFVLVRLPKKRMMVETFLIGKTSVLPPGVIIAPLNRSFLRTIETTLQDHLIPSAPEASPPSDLPHYLKLPLKLPSEFIINFLNTDTLASKIDFLRSGGFAPLPPPNSR